MGLKGHGLPAVPRSWSVLCLSCLATSQPGAAPEGLLARVDVAGLLRCHVSMANNINLLGVQ